jgi:hypothetical protein
MVKNQPRAGRKTPYDDADKPWLRSRKSICGSNRTCREVQLVQRHVGFNSLQRIGIDEKRCLHRAIVPPQPDDPPRSIIKAAWIWKTKRHASGPARVFRKPLLWRFNVRPRAAPPKAWLQAYDSNLDQALVTAFQSAAATRPSSLISKRSLQLRGGSWPCTAFAAKPAVCVLSV